MKRFLPFALILIGLGFWCWRQLLRPVTLPTPPRTVTQVLSALGPKVDAQLAPLFYAAGVSYPPEAMTLIAFKAEKRLDVFASNPQGADPAARAPRWIFSWPILSASGTAGPKIKEGDLQVPEGFYHFELLNPNSRFHLSLRVNYPNADDIRRGQEEARPLGTLGGDIMIHGGVDSTGCLAIGDPAIEELFVLAARTGLDAIQLIIAPCDFRIRRISDLPASAPAWTGARHEALRRALEKFPTQK